MQRKRLLWQFFPYFLIVSLASILTASWYASRSLHRFYVERTAVDLEARARLARGELGKLFKPADAAGIDRLCRQLGHDSGTRITAILPSGQVVGDSDEPWAQMDNHATRPEIAEALQGRTGASTRYSKTLQRNMMYVAVPVEQDGAVVGVIRAALALYSVEEPFRTLRLELIAGVLFLVLLAGIGSLAVSRRLSRPIEEMKQAAERFALGNLSHRVPVPDSEELGGLAEVLNRLASDLGEKIAQLERQKNEQDAMFASMVEGVVAVDENERIIHINQAAADFFGIRPDDAVQRSLMEIARNVGLQDVCEKILAGEQPAERDIVIYNGQERNLQAHAVTLRNELGRSMGAMIVLHDVTRMRKLESLRRDFVANVSHELKTPITSIKGFVETLLEGAVDQPEDARRFLGIIAKHADRLNAIIEDLLALSRIEQESDHGQIVLEEASLKSVLVSAVQLCQVKADAKEARIELDCDDTLVAKVNAPLLEQAIANLIDNAIKYSAPGKTIHLQVKASATGILLSVRDEGCGIEAEHLSRLFERFYRVDKARSRQLGGTGLGLSIAKHIVLAHGGTIGVESVAGSGSTFTIALPLIPR